jgi:hypothetical protein
MWSSPERRVLLLVLMLVVGAAEAAPANPAEICPARPGDSVRFIDVFDGKPDEHATLAPDSSRHGIDMFTLGHIYDDGRTVTIRCKYRSGTRTDIELRDKVEACRVADRKSGGLSVLCG